MTNEHSQFGKVLNLVEEDENTNFEFIELNNTDDNSTEISEAIEINDNEEFLNIIEHEEESLAERPGPKLLQRIMEQMEQLRLPLELWRTFINTSVRIIALTGFEFDLHTLIEIIIFVVTIIAEFYIGSIYLKAVIAIFAFVGPTIITQIIKYIHSIFNHIVNKLLEYVKKKLGEFYELSAEFIREYSMPNSR
ncbi:hypothetical protein PV327_008934 [Microctonus hyperodae]|uniref:Uncharacterized protein n=1 Tax=Microctonus hyperodae TaxID=165561 RepID=A0AA39FTS7_MICHY|nr:hypothetical protein PV327_008934 [Microctonus hyperodae]